jgi:transcriptional regulator with XRE-family HTH domain
MGALMAKRRMKMRYIKRVLKLATTQGLSLRDIEKVSGLARSTVNNYIKRFNDSGLTIEQLEELSEAQIYRNLFSEPVRTKGKVRPDYSYMHLELKRPHVTRVLVPDNLKAAVSKADRYDPVINESYQDMADHYNTVVIPVRPYKPQDKSKVELAVKLVQRWILARIRNEVFYSIEELNGRLRECLEIFNHKTIRSLGKSRYELYMELDKPALQALPAAPYEFKEFRYKRVMMDYHISLDDNFYSVPYQLKGKEVQVRFNASKVQVYHDNQQVALHPRLTGKGQASTLKEHMPEAHRAYALQSPSSLINQSFEIGPHTSSLIRRFLEEQSHPEKNYRQALAILRAAKKHNNHTESELASAKMLALNIRRASHFESILKRKAWEPEGCGDLLFPEVNSADEHVRGAEYYN